MMSDSTNGIIEKRRSLERVQISYVYDRNGSSTYPTVSPQVGS